MANLTLKGIPPDLHLQLRERAARNRRSLNAEILRILEDSLRRKVVDVEDLIARIHESNRRWKTKPFTEEEWRAAKAERPR